MKNFIYDINTQLHFGQNMLDTLAESIKEHTNKKILITYGGGSIKASGLYDQVIKILNENMIEHIELSGIKPNPEVDTARLGAKLIKEHSIDFILAIGGGSVIDNTKHMAAAAATDVDIWDMVKGAPHKLDSKKIPKIGTIITLAATGSEMNFGGVLSNPETKEKLAYGDKRLRPVFTYEDPSQLMTLPEYQRRAGVSDILSHILEVYFSSHQDVGIDDRLSEAIFKNTMNYGEDYIAGNDYDTLANIFWSSTLGLNGITRLSRGAGDWFAHAVEHEVSAITDLTHGIGLAIIHPKVIRFYYENDLKLNNSLIKYENFGVNVFDFERKDPELALKTVAAIEDLFARFGNVKYLEDVEIESLDIEHIASRINDHNHSDYLRFTLDEYREFVTRLFKK